MTQLPEVHEPRRPPVELPVNTTLQLSARTLDWLADNSHARRLVRSVWDTLAELERAGQYPGAVAAFLHRVAPSSR